MKTILRDYDMLSYAQKGYELQYILRDSWLRFEINVQNCANVFVVYKLSNQVVRNQPESCTGLLRLFL